MLLNSKTEIEVITELINYEDEVSNLQDRLEDIGVSVEIPIGCGCIWNAILGEYKEWEYLYSDIICNHKLSPENRARKLVRTINKAREEDKEAGKNEDE